MPLNLRSQTNTIVCTDLINIPGSPSKNSMNGSLLCAFFGLLLWHRVRCTLMTQWCACLSSCASAAREGQLCHFQSRDVVSASYDAGHVLSQTSWQKKGNI